MATISLLVATLAAAVAAPEVSELVEAEGRFRERVLHGCHRDRPEFSHVRGRPLVSGVGGKSGLTDLHIVWSLGQVVLAADCVDAFEVEFQQVEVEACAIASCAVKKVSKAGLQKMQCPSQLSGADGSKIS